MIFFTCAFWPNFNTNDFELCKGFSMEKMVQICQILMNFFSKLPYFCDKFQTMTKNIEGFFSKKTPFHI